MKKIKPDQSSILKSGDVYTFETFKFVKNADGKSIAVHDRFVEGTLVDVSTKWKTIKKKDNASGEESSETILIWDILRFVPVENSFKWTENESLKIYQTVVTAGFFQICAE